MATINAQQAWRNAEQRCFDYFLTVLSGERGVTAYSPDDGLPRQANKASDLEMWTFEINGGGEPKLQQTRPMQSWLMGAMLRGVFTTRKRAQRIAGLVMDNLPVQDTTVISGVSWLCWSENPSLTRDVVVLANDLAAGGEVRVWALTYPMVVAFNNTTV